MQKKKERKKKKKKHESSSSEIIKIKFVCRRNTIFAMMFHEYEHNNPSGFCFEVYLRALVIKNCIHIGTHKPQACFTDPGTNGKW